MGNKHSIHIANATSEDIYVLAYLSPDWAIVDAITNITVIAAALQQFKTCTALGELPAKITSIRDIFQTLLAVRKVIVSGAQGVKAAMAVTEAFKKTAVKIPAGTFKNVKSEDFLSIYLKAHGIAGLIGAKTVTLMVMAGEGKDLRAAMWNSGSDHSWIATKRGVIVRSRYGTLWQENPGAGTIACGK